MNEERNLREKGKTITPDVDLKRVYFFAEKVKPDDMLDQEWEVVINKEGDEREESYQNHYSCPSWDIPMNVAAYFNGKLWYESRNSSTWNNSEDETSLDYLLHNHVIPTIKKVASVYPIVIHEELLFVHDKDVANAVKSPEYYFQDLKNIFFKRTNEI